ncbi:MAG: MerR family transcriptional regulator [Chloroflexota bacterium]|nr:MerR family transcriptional regulator [Chloroflexota bacterium]
MATDATYTLHELADLADVTPRTIRYYIAQGLLPSPGQAGPGARYTDGHLDRIRLIKKLQRAHLPLAEIRSQIRPLNDRQIAALADSQPEPSPRGSAVDYIRSVMGDAPTPTPAVARAMPPAAMATAESLGRAIDDTPTAAPSATPDRSQWERVVLTPDIELHIRRPLTRHQNRRVDRLITIARDLLEEEPK